MFATFEHFIYNTLITTFMFETIVAWYAPHACIGCNRPSNLLCLVCQDGLPAAAERCYRCRALSESGRTCRDCRRQSPLYSVRAATSYDGVSKDLVRKFKFDGARAAAVPIARVMNKLLGVGDEAALLVPVPTASSRRRLRGFDQSRLIVRALAEGSGLGYASSLGRSGQARQVGSTREQRLSQLAHSFYVRGNTSKVAGRYVILIDDVMTTGATLEAAAATLRAAGAKRVEAIVFARA